MINDPRNLAEASESVREDGKSVTAYVDNDDVSFYDGGGNHLFSLHPSEVIEQALGLLRITVEPV